MEPQVDVEEVLKNMREHLGGLAQEIAILKAQISKLTADS